MATQTLESEPSLLNEIVQPHVSDPKWQIGAECTVGVADDFMGRVLRRGGSKTELSLEDRYKVAMFCGQCGVRSDCLAQALLTKEEYGVQGGLSQGQRQVLQAEFSQNNFIDDDTWSEAVGKAEVVREEFLDEQAREKAEPYSVRKGRLHKKTEALHALIVDTLKQQPSETYMAPNASALYEELAAETGFRPGQLEVAIRRLSSLGVIEKELGELGNITGLRLVS